MRDPCAAAARSRKAVGVIAAQACVAAVVFASGITEDAVVDRLQQSHGLGIVLRIEPGLVVALCRHAPGSSLHISGGHARSEEHTSELQSRRDLVCRLLLEKKKKKRNRD